MTQHDDAVYLEHILECIDLIAERTRSGRESLEDGTIRDSVLRRLHTLTESVQKVSPVLKARYPEVPWREISGFRNVVVHDYLGINLDLVWDIIENRLPLLRPIVEQLLRDK